MWNARNNDIINRLRSDDKRVGNTLVYMVFNVLISWKPPPWSQLRPHSTSWEFGVTYGWSMYALFDSAQILAYLVHNMNNRPVSQIL